MLAQRKVLESIPKLVTSEDNTFLKKPFSLEEIKGALFSMNPDKSPGPDAFQTIFIKSVGISLEQIYGML